MKSLFRKLLLGVLTVVLVGAGGIGLRQWYRLATRPSMEKAGGTVLVYEVDVDKLPEGQLPPNYQPQELADALKRRLDPSDDLGIVVRPLEDTRVEISIPGARLTAEQRGLGITSEAVQRVKDLVNQVGLLEFRILANEQDDQAALTAARAYFDLINDPKVSDEQRNARRAAEDRRAARGLPPQGPSTADGNTLFRWSTPWGSGAAKYSWVELSRWERTTLGLHNEAETDPQRNQLWQQVARARAQGTLAILPDSGRTAVFSRPCQNLRLAPAERENKKYDYFFLTREPRPEERVTSQHLLRATAVEDHSQRPAVDFQLTAAGGELFHTLTSLNRPTSGAGEPFSRQLAISLDDSIITAPRLREAIRDYGRISGIFTTEEVATLVSILRAGALPVALKPLPLSETVVEPTK